MKVLLSSKRSGTNLLCFTSSFIHRRPFKNPKKERPFEQMEKILKIPYDSQEPLFYRTHEVKDCEKATKLVLLIRNPIELMLRNKIELKDFIKLLEFFDNFTQEKLLIYYEDLIQFPRTVFTEFFNFFELDFGKYVDHTTEILKAYKLVHQTSGKSKSEPNYYSKQVEIERTKSIENELHKMSPDLYCKYLKRFEWKAASGF